MKLLRFTKTNSSEIQFGIFLNNFCISFQDLQRINEVDYPCLNRIDSYMQNHPASEEQAIALIEHFRQQFPRMSSKYFIPLDKVDVLPPLSPPAAILDFGLSPRHLKNSALTLMKYEKKWPVRPILRFLIKCFYSAKDASFKHYKGNHNSVTGDQDVIQWPEFTSYLDIEPELGVVVGNAKKDMPWEDVDSAIAGYTIFNDLSARDVQWPEMKGMFGPTRCKDFKASNGIGPFIVSREEVPDPLDLQVSVNIGDRLRFEGNTSGYSRTPGEVIYYLTRYRDIEPGTLIGMGTVPGCCGLDRDEWLLPGEEVQISMDRLGSLHQVITDEVPGLQPTRWKARAELGKYYR